MALLNVCGRPGGGIGGVVALAERVRAEFGKGVRFGKVRVYEKPAANVMPAEPSRLAVAVTIRWAGFDK